MKRECGSCHACCIFLSVDDDAANFHKEMGVPCQHLKDGKCSIYSTKPGICTEYFCMYLAGGDGLPTAPFAAKLIKDNERPSDCGILISMNNPNAEFRKATGIVAFTAYEIKPGAARGYWGKKIISRISKKTVVFIRQFGSEELIGVGPPKLIQIAKRFEADALLGKKTYDG